jgi:hypothetical protein
MSGVKREASGLSVSLVSRFNLTSSSHFLPRNFPIFLVGRFLHMRKVLPIVSERVRKRQTLTPFQK